MALLPFLGKQKTPILYNEDLCSDTELSTTSIETALASWKSTQEGREIVSQVFPVSVDVLFSLLFNDSKFYNDFQESRKTFGKKNVGVQYKPLFIRETCFRKYPVNL